ncbi:MAG: trypsin-like peptidase domain-containing protein [Bacteroidales bacterium]|nr:trypsin-like peptidase domain-containing protein [Bacteroidales bacterium]
MAGEKKYRYLFAGALVSLLFPAILPGQIEYPGKLMAEGFQKTATEFIRLPDAGVLAKSLLVEQGNQDGYKADVFAAVAHVEILPSRDPAWHQNEQGTYVWKRGFTASGASSIGLTLRPYRLNQGVKIFVYSPGAGTVFGAFTFRNNNEARVLSLGSLPGDSLIIEIQSARGPEYIGELAIATAGIGFPGRDLPPHEKDGYYGWSAECEIDINCLDISRYQLQKLSVCRLVIEEGNVRKRCTGTLLNNTSEDGTPYVLTARHCVRNEDAANNTVFSFDYESPFCEGPDGEIKSVSGSTIISTGELMDFVLLKLFERPPVDYTPVYAGWDAGPDAPQGSYIIHHPEGDVKKISYDVEEATTTSFGGYKDETFWLVESYEEGSTENGSSGGGLFNSNNRLVGSLTGGGTVCSNLINDCYQKFSEGWLGSEDSSLQLKHWLDPDNTGKTVLENLDIYAGVTTSLTNLSDLSVLGIPKLKNGWGYVSGHNSLGSVQFAEYFPLLGTNYVYAVNLKVAKAWFQTEDMAGVEDGTPTLRLKLWDDGDKPAKVLFSKDLFSFELEPDMDNYIRLDTLIQVNKGFYAGYEIFYNALSDTFALYTGIPVDAPQVRTAVMNTGHGWELLNDGEQELQLALALSPSVMDYYPQPGVGKGDFPDEQVTLYPNPAGDFLQILFKDVPTEDVTVTLYDLYGNFIFKQTYSPTPANLQLRLTKLVSRGMFILKLDYGENTVTKKFVKI